MLPVIEKSSRGETFAYCTVYIIVNILDHLANDFMQVLFICCAVVKWIEFIAKNLPSLLMSLFLK
jgi:hypothetical protein